MKKFNVIEEGRLSDNAMHNLKGGDCIKYFCWPSYQIKGCKMYVICGESKDKDSMYNSCSGEDKHLICGGKGEKYKGDPGPGGFIPLLP